MKNVKKKSGEQREMGSTTPVDHPQPSEKVGVARLNLTAETLERLIAEAQHQQHPYGKVWQRFDLGTFTELVENVDRRGLDQEILLYQDMILEGWHRYLACIFTKTTPKFCEFNGKDLAAAERVHASGVRRQSTPDQRYASFDLLCQACPAFQEKYQQLNLLGIQQKQTGRPLSTGGQRVDVVGAKAAAAGVSRSTAAKVEKVKKEKPEAVAEIAAGRTSANKVLNKNKKTDRPKTSGGKGITADAPTQANEAAAAPAHRPLLDELTDITQSLQAVPDFMNHLDWSKENEKAWDTVGKAASGAVDSIATKAMEGFTSVKKSKPTCARLE